MPSHKEYPHTVTQTNNTLIHIPMKDMSQPNQTPDQIIQNHVATMVEGHCTNFGYVVPGSVALIRREMGKVLSVDSTSQVEYRVTYTFDSLNPCPGDKYDVHVISITKAGLLCSLPDFEKLIDSPLLFIIPNQDTCLNDKPLSSYTEGDQLEVSTIKTRVKFRSRQIQVVAKIV